MFINFILRTDSGISANSEGVVRRFNPRSLLTALTAIVTSVMLAAVLPPTAEARTRYPADSLMRQQFEVAGFREPALTINPRFLKKWNSVRASYSKERGNPEWTHLASLVVGSIGVSKPAVSATWDDLKDKPDVLNTMYFLGVYD